MMGSNRFKIIYLVFSLSLWSIVHGLDSYDPESLDALILNRASKELVKHRTGDLFKIALPSNFSGMTVSVLMLRSSSFWARGADLDYLHIPPRVIPIPFVKRIAIIFENLGNWSSYYYQVPGYSLVAPVVGFRAYDASNLSSLGNQQLNLSIIGDPISITFPHIALHDRNATPHCVNFGSINGGFELGNKTVKSACIRHGQGYVSIVVLSLPPAPGKSKKGLDWWVIVIVGVVLLVVVGIVIYKVARRKMIREMERESEKGEAFEVSWIGKSRMPSAAMVRTQPAIETDYVP